MGSPLGKKVFLFSGRYEDVAVSFLPEETVSAVPDFAVVFFPSADT